jgi:multiple sugar transport system permease protein
LAFVILPILAVVALSFFKWDLFKPPQFVGLGNYRNIFGWYFEEDGTIHLRDAAFWQCLGNTLFLMLTIPVSMASSLLLAVILNQKLLGRTMFRTIFYLPSICAGVGLMLLWKYLYNSEVGLINQALAWLGIDGPHWLTSYRWAKPSLMIMMVWVTVGGTNMVLYLAGLQSISPELYEAADIDGAGTVQKFTHITLPMLRPVTFFILITSIIAGFQGGFDAAYVMTNGGPNGATTTLNYYIFNHAFVWFNTGYASALAMVMFGITIVVTLISWRAAPEGGQPPK